MRRTLPHSGIFLHNYRAALDAATALCLHIGRQRRGASERGMLGTIVHMNQPGSSPSQDNHPPPIPLRLAAGEPSDQAPPIVPQVRVSTEDLASMRAEYRRIKADRAKWRVLSLVFGGSGILLILLVDPNKAPTFLIIAALVMFALGMMFSGKFKGRGLWWGFTAFGRIHLIRRAMEPDLLKARLEELRRTLEALGEKL